MEATEDEGDYKWRVEQSGEPDEARANLTLECEIQMGRALSGRPPTTFALLALACLSLARSRLIDRQFRKR